MNLADRKQVEIRHKLEGLDREFQRWEKASAEGAALQKHNSQIRSILLPLRALRKRIETDLAIVTGEAYLAESRKATQLILGIHRIWEFFRSKFAQRSDSRFQEFLAIADEFAWVCYAPVMNKTSFRRPPLVFLNGGASPFIMRHDDRFEAEATSSGSVDDKDFEAVLAHLPFAVIGVPWHEIEYWPEIVVIGHEVGHAVERDLNLSAPLDKAIDDVLAGSGGARAKYWKAWRSELFADVYGCMATGPAFLSALVDFLANSRQALEAASASAQSDYPPTLLRVIFNQAVLSASGLDSKIPDWDEKFPQQIAKFVPEAIAIAKAFVADGGPMDGLLRFTTTDWDEARERAQKAKDREASNPVSDLRTPIAAIRHAFDTDPDHWDKVDAARGPGDRSPLCQLRASIEAVVKAEVRAGEGPPSAERDAADEAAADPIYELLLKTDMEVVK
jgi:hypothetical protein